MAPREEEDYRFVVKQYVVFALKRLFILKDRNKPGFSNRICKINSIRSRYEVFKSVFARKTKVLATVLKFMRVPGTDQSREIMRNGSQNNKDLWRIFTRWSFSCD